MSQAAESEQTDKPSSAAAAAAAAASTTTAAPSASSSASSVGAVSDAPSSEEDHEVLREQVIAQQRARRQKKQHDDWEAVRRGFKDLEEADNWRQLKHAVNFGRWSSTASGQGMVGGRMRVHWDGVVGQMEEATHSLVYSTIFLEQVVRTHVNAAASLGVAGVWLQCESC